MESIRTLNPFNEIQLMKSIRTLNPSIFLHFNIITLFDNAYLDLMINCPYFISLCLNQSYVRECVIKQLRKSFELMWKILLFGDV